MKRITLQAWAEKPDPIAVDLVQILAIDKLRDLPEADGSGLYFLWKGIELLYIGLSVDIYRRCREHEMTFPVNFDRYTGLLLDEINLRNHEHAYIAHYRPPYNRTYPL